MFECQVTGTNIELDLGSQTNLGLHRAASTNQERVFVPRHTANMKPEILLQDESLIAVAKPAGKSSEDCASVCLGMSMTARGG